MARCAKWLCRPLIAGVGAIRWVRYTYQFRIVVKLLFLRSAVDPAPFLRCKGMLQSEHPYEAAMEVGSRVCDCAVVSLRLYARLWLASCVCVCGCVASHQRCTLACVCAFMCLFVASRVHHSMLVMRRSHSWWMSCLPSNPTSTFPSMSTFRTARCLIPRGA